MPQLPHHKRIWHTTPWKWFFSLQTGIALLVLLTLASIFGTLIDPLEKAQALVYHTWWYQLLLLALAVSLACTTFRTLTEKTLPSLQLRFRDPREFRKRDASCAAFAHAGGVESAAGALKSQHFHVATQGNLGTAWKGKINRFGAPVAHLGIFVMLLGGFLSAWVSREGVVNVAEGEETQEMEMSSAPGQPVPLGFRIRCDQFETDFFSKTRIPSKYISSLTVTGPQGTTLTGKVEVNHSLKAFGWTIHQTSYEEISGKNRFLLAIDSGNSGAGTPQTAAASQSPNSAPPPMELKLSPGQTYSLPTIPNAEITLGDKFPYPWTIKEGGVVRASGVIKANAEALRLRVDSFLADFTIGEDRKPVSRSDQMNNPAVHVTVLEEEREISGQWLFAREDLKAMMHKKSDVPYEFDFAKVTGSGKTARFDVSARETTGDTPPHEFHLGLGEEAILAPSSAEPTTASQKSEPTEKAGEFPAGWKVAVIKTVPAYRTTLTLTRNPALSVVYAGCALIMVGLLLAFGIEYKVIRFAADPQSGLLHVAALYRLPREGFDRSAARALRQLGCDVSVANASLPKSAPTRADKSKSDREDSPE